MPNLGQSASLVPFAGAPNRGLGPALGIPSPQHCVPPQVHPAALLSGRRAEISDCCPARR